MFKTVLLTASLALAACGDIQPVYFGSGRPGFLVTCSDLSGGYDGCFRRAGSVCGPAGYLLADWNGRILAGTRSDMFATQSEAVEHALLITCRT